MVNLIHGDCFSVMEDMVSQGVKVDLILTDPPYILSSNPGGTVNTIKKLNTSLNNGVIKSKIHTGYDYERAFDLFDKLQDNINVYFFCSKKQIMTYLNRYVNIKKCTYNILLWNKKNALPTYHNKYLTDCEYILHFRKGVKCHPESYDDAKTVYYGNINAKDKKLYGHPTIKPLPLVEKFVRNSSYEGEIVFDPFMGSGTTGVAGLLNKRDFIGIEKDDRYYEIAQRRIGEHLF